MKEVFDNIAYKKKLNADNIINPEAMKNLILRVTNSEVYANKFEFVQLEEKEQDCYRLYDKDEKIVIEATSGVAAAVAFNLYLREFCNSYVGPINRNIKLPEQPPVIGKIIENKSVFLFRYFLNYCTFSYSLLFATWEEYEKLTDWMLLSGVNLYLNIVGHEIVWRDMLLELGYTKEEVSDYICGPAYLPWQWMGNMSHFGGNLPEWWYDEQKNLGNKINAKMRMFGAEPILPGYFGMVPQDFNEKFPLSQPVGQGMWCDCFEQPSLLLPNDKMFNDVADLFYGLTKKHFGDIHYFSGDPFHEGGNSENFDLVEYGKAIINKMKAHSSNGIWFLQGWTETPKREMLDAMDKADVVVISLAADKNYNTCDNFNGNAWIYSATPNFGGTRIMDGNLKGFLLEPYDAVMREDITNVGIGMTMEGIELDEIIYEGISYNSIRDKKPEMQTFLTHYANARYGICNKNLLEFLTILADDIFVLNKNNIFSGRESGLCAKPSLDVKSVSASSEEFSVSYDENKLILCKDLLINEYECLKNNECYLFDLTDVLRQINSNKSWHYIDKFVLAFKNNDYESFEKYSKAFLTLYEEQERILENSKLRLDNFVFHAKRYGRNIYEKEMFAFNAVNMIMLWSDIKNPDVLMDYAHREWYGLLDFYRERWSVFIELMRINFNKPQNITPLDWRIMSMAKTLKIIK